MVSAPPDAQLPLIAGHSYLFKTADDWRAQQVWSEVIASQIGALVGVPVPPCFIAFDGDVQRTGALVEFFYGYPGEVPPMRFAHGSDMLTALYPSAKARGRPHFVRMNVAICRRVSPEGAVDWWGKTLTFDALIGNTDRHTENWGLLGRLLADQARDLAIAPAFDNGTSLGYEQSESAINEKWSEKKTANYIASGRHHCSWEIDDETVRGHLDLCRRYFAKHPEAGNAMRSVIRFERSQIDAITEWCASVDVGIRFSSARARFVSDLVEARQAQLRSVLGGEDA